MENALTDMNGDGLPDIVKQDGSVSFVGFADGSRTSVQKVTSPAVSLADLSTVGCAPVHDSRFPVFAPGLPLGSSSQTTATVNVGVHLFGFAGGSGAVSWTWGKEGQQFSDFDGDGLPDIISTCGGSGVQVARTTYDSTGTLVIGGSIPPTGMSGATTLTMADATFDQTAGGTICDSSNGTCATQDDLNRHLHPVSPLVSWTAPFSGHVIISGTVQRNPVAVGTSSSAGPVQQDGVVAAIDRATNGLFIPLTVNVWKAPLTDTSVCTPSGTSGCDGATSIETDVGRGDRIYFHVDPGSDTQGDTTVWAPTVDYKCLNLGFFGCLNLTAAQKATTDPFGLPRFTYALSQDFRTIDPSPPSFYAHVTGLVNVTITANGTASHDITLRVLKNGGRLASGGVITIPQGTTGPQTYTVGPIAVTSSAPTGSSSSIPDQIVVEANYTQAQVDPGAFSLLPRIDYTQVCEFDADKTGTATTPDCRNVSCQSVNGTEVCTVENTDPPIRLPPEKLTAFPEIRDSFQSNDPLAGVSVPADGAYTIAGLLNKKAETQFPVALSIISDQQPNPLFQASLDPAGIPSANLPQDEPAAGATSNPSNPVTLTSGERITAVMEFETVSDYFNLSDLFTVDWSVTLTDVNGTVLTVPLAVRFPPSGEQVRMMGGFRGWKYGEWNQDRAVNGNFNEFILFSTPDNSHAAALLRVSPRTPRLPSVPALPNVPATTPVIVRETPDGRQQFTGGVWLGAGPDSFIAAGVMKPSRVGGVDPTRAALGGPDTLRKTFTQMAGLDAAVFVSGGVSSGNTVTRLEFMDLNGDCRPDSVAYNRASFFDDRTGQYISGDPLGMAANGSLRLSEVNFTRFGAGFGTAASALVGAISPSSTKLKAAVSILPSLEHNTGKTDELSEFLDVNGDGLPDHVRVVNGVPQVQINLGYTFGPELPATAWPLPASASCSSPLSCEEADTNSLQVGFAGLGGGIAYSTAVKTVEYVDINGDGLPDRLTRLPDSAAVSVDLNMGTYFSPDTWSIPAGWPSIQLTNPVMSVTGTESDALGMHETRTTNAGAGIFLPIQHSPGASSGLPRD